jgi:putative ABC transport system permease protein
MLRKNPGFTAVVITTLALGIGANSAIFSVVDAVLLKPLPYPQSDRLVIVREAVRVPGSERDQDTISPGDFTDWRQRATVFENIAAFAYRSFDLNDLSEAARPTRVEGDLVSASFFSVLGVEAALGRVFTADEDRYGGPPVAVLSRSLWISRFGGDPRAVGRTIRLDGRTYTVVGVMPEWFHFPAPDDEVWVPLDLSPDESANRANQSLMVIGRLKPFVRQAQALADMQGIARQLAAQFPATNAGVGVNLLSLREQIAGNVRPAILILWGSTGLVLLIVCANVASLLLTRAAVRSREFGIRVALGAGRGRLLRQLLTESVLMACLGGLLAVFVAAWGIRALRWISPPPSFPYLPRLDEITINGMVLAATAAIALTAGILLGIVPLFQIGRDIVFDSLKDGGRGASFGVRGWTRATLIAFEMALGTVVLVGTVLLLRSFWQLNRAPLGFRPQQVLTMRVIPRGPKYPTVTERAAFFDQICQRIEAIPGVQRAAAVTLMPLTLARDVRRFVIEGRARPAPGEEPAADSRVVTSGYFQSMGIQVIEGRAFTDADRAGSLPVVIVSQAMARRFWPDGRALGEQIELSGFDSTRSHLTIVGVVGDVRDFDVIHGPEPTMYLPYSQGEDAQLVLRDIVVRAAVSPSSIASSVRDAIWSVDRDLSVARVRTMNEVYSIAVAPQRFNLLLLGVIAILAVILAAEGLYGVTSYTVARRTREIGLRMALGAERRQVLTLVLAEGARLTVLGVVAGFAGALLVTSVMKRLLFGVTPYDPLTYVVVAALLSVITLTACYLPARRASNIEPLTALRTE